MAEEDVEGLEILLQQRLQRPSYTRGISQELSNTESQPSAKTRRNVIKYNTLKNTPDSRVENADVCGKCTEMSGEEDGWTTDEEVPISDVNEQQILKNPTRVHKNPKMRKRQRKKLRGERLDNLPFTQEDKLPDFDLQLSEQLNTMTVGVPSLTSLCLESYCKKHTAAHHTAHAPLLPLQMSGELKQQIRQRITRQLLVKHLYRMLDLEEAAYLCSLKSHLGDSLCRDCYNHNQIKHIGKCNERIKEDSLFVPVACRSVWLSSSFDRPYNDQRSESNFTDKSGHLLDQIGFVPYLGYCINGRSRSLSGDNLPSAVTTLAALIDILMPAELRLKTAYVRVKIMLSKRFPTLVRFLFWKAIPYVLWKRGESALAEESFHSLLRNTSIIKTDALKALYTNELARMYIHFNEWGKATRTYSVAGEISAPKGGPLIDLQTQILVASSLDIGVRTVNQGSASVSAWSQVLERRVGDLFYTCVSAAVASIMHHNADVTFDRDTSTWSESAMKWLQTHSRQYPQCYLNIALLHAMNGDTEQCIQIFRTYTNRYVDTHFFGHRPGFGWIDQMERRSNPFAAITECVEQYKHPIPPMRMVWRRQLWHFSLNSFSKKAWVGDADHEGHSKLWLTEDGFLACDVHVTLPVITQLRLHPLTGEIQFGKDIGPLGICHLPEPTEYGEYFLPRTYILHQDANVTVRLTDWVFKNVQMDSQSVNPRLSCENSDGQLQEIYLKKIIRDKVVQDTRKRIEKEACELPEQYKQRFIKAHRDVLEKNLTAGTDIQYHVVHEQVRIEDSHDYRHNGKANKKKTRKHCPGLFCPNIVKSCFMAGHLILMFSLDNDARTHTYRMDAVSVIMIICLIDRKTFYSPVVVCADFPNFFKPMLARTFDESIHPEMIRGCYRHECSVCRSSADVAEAVFAVRLKDDPYKCNFKYRDFQKSPKVDSFVFYNMAGEQVKSTDYKRDRNNAVIVNGSLFSIHTGSSELKKTPLLAAEETDFESLLLPDPRKAMFALEDALFVLTTENLIVIHTKAMKKLPWKMYTQSCILLEEENTHLTLHHRFKLRLLHSQTFDAPLTSLSGPVVRAIVGFGNHVMLVEIPLNSERLEEIHCLLDVETVGTPTEACFIGTKGGILVTATLYHEEDKDEYEEVLYHYSNTGQILALLPGLGRGPHEFYPLYHPGTSDYEDRYPEVPYKEPGWFVYMRDGHGAITCVRTRV